MTSMPTCSFWSSTALLLGLISPLSAGAVTAPYSIDFHQYSPGVHSFPDLSPYNVGTFNATISAYGTLEMPTLSSTRLSVQITNLVGKDFEVWADLGITGDGTYRLFGGGYDLSCILGTLWLSNQHGDYCGSGGRLTLRGHVHDGLMDLVGTYGTGKITLASNNLALRTGEDYGVEVTIFSPRHEVTGHWGAFSVTPVVPEPSSALLLPVCALLLRRHRH